MDKEALCKKLEHYETPEWAVEAVAYVESMSGIVVDPCAGTRVMERILDQIGAPVVSYDIHDWRVGARTPVDFLAPEADPHQADIIKDGCVIMNPPFSKAVAFVERALDLGAHKILCFCPMTFWASMNRRRFWDAHPVSRIHVLSERATCWRHDIPPERRVGTTPTLYAWFVWERGHTGPIITRLYRCDKEPS